MMLKRVSQTSAHLIALKRQVKAFIRKSNINQEIGTCSVSDEEHVDFGLADKENHGTLDIPQQGADSAGAVCCCGCGGNVNGSHHTCSVTGRKVFAFCLQESETNEGFNSSGPCTRCASHLSVTNNKKGKRESKKPKRYEY